MYLKPHRGPYNGVLRLHLGLLVPATPPQTVAIRVDNEVCHWQEGKVLIFDDSYEHEAWNHSNETRVVLFVDFVKPLRFPASFVNWLILNIALFTPFIREAKKAYKEWEDTGFSEAETRLRLPHPQRQSSSQRRAQAAPYSRPKGYEGKECALGQKNPRWRSSRPAAS